MWIGVRSAFVLLCFCSILLPVLTNEAFFGKNSPVKAGRCLMQGSETPEHVRSRYKVLMVNFLIAGQGFYDENQYDDGYAEYTGKNEIFTVLFIAICCEWNTGKQNLQYLLLS